MSSRRGRGKGKRFSSRSATDSPISKQPKLAKKTPEAEAILPDPESNNLQVEDSTGNDTATATTSPRSQQSSDEPVQPKAAFGKPIASHQQSRWPAWRTMFFTNWREDGKRIEAQCTMSQCVDIEPLKSDWSSFSNFQSHCERLHRDEWDKLKNARDEDGVKSGNSQRSMTSYTFSKKQSTSRQHQLDIDLVRVMSEDNLPINVLRRQRFRNWIKVCIQI